MTDLFEQVLHHIEGSETEIQNWQTVDGIKTIEFHSIGPDRWIENVHERGRMTGTECLAMILFAVDESLFNPEPARRIVESWAVELRKALTAGEIQARDPVTLLALETLPDGWEWLVSMADADKFIAARGMEWRFAEIALHLFKQCEQAIDKRRFAFWTDDTKQAAPAKDTATPAPDELDYSLLATPAELVDAFGKWGALKIEWFDDLNSRKWLADARRQKGQGTQGQVRKPLFCPYAVMTGLVEKVRKENRIRPDTAWRTLEHKFPRVHAAFADYDTRERTGD